MDFFTKLSKKATETYQEAKEKASNISEELKIKGKINELKQKVEDYYVEIGKKVYSELKDGKIVAEEEILEKCNEISRTNDEIGKLKEKLLSLKKMKTCVKCNAKLDVEDLYCPKCGEKQPKPEKIEVEEEPKSGAQEAEVIEVTDTKNEKDDKKQE